MAKYTKAVVIMFVLSAVVLFLAVGSALYLKGESEHDNCEGVNELRVTLQGILTRSESLALQNPDYTEPEKEAAVTFYTRTIKDLEPTSC